MYGILSTKVPALSALLADLVDLDETDLLEWRCLDFRGPGTGPPIMSVSSAHSSGIESKSENVF